MLYDCRGHPLTQIRFSPGKTRLLVCKSNFCTQLNAISHIKHINTLCINTLFVHWFLFLIGKFESLNIRLAKRLAHMLETVGGIVERSVDIALKARANCWSAAVSTIFKVTGRLILSIRSIQRFKASSWIPFNALLTGSRSVAGLFPRRRRPRKVSQLTSNYFAIGAKTGFSRVS